MNPLIKQFTLALILLVYLPAAAQNNFPNGIFVNKGTSDGGSAIFVGTTHASHFHYSTTEDTYIRGGKSTSHVLIGDVGTHVILGNTSGNVYSQGLLVANNGLYGVKGNSAGGSAIFVGTTHASHFNYSTTEDTYIRGGKSTSNIYIADVNSNVIMGAVPAQPAGYRLFVDKGILTEKVKVAIKTSADWADHVFNKDYPLMPLGQVEQYIRKNGHLPGIPSATEVVNEGIDLGKMNAKLLEKVEELTLYIIQLKKETEQKIAALEKKVNQ
jgi:hypothetical protein